MSVVPIMLIMMHQQMRRTEEQARRRREEEEKRRKKRKEEERKKQEAQRKMVEHRKNSPVVCNGEQWQQERIVKAISLQPCVQSFISTIEKVRPQIIETEERKYDERIIATGYEYETLRNALESDIETLKSMGISIRGEQYQLSRLTPLNTHVERPEQVTESLGNTFIVNNGQPIDLNPRILSSTHYQDRYEEMHPVEIEEQFIDTNTRMRRYQRFGKYLGFLLRTKKYQELEEYSKEITKKHEQCELRKKEMQSFQSLTKEQLIVIKAYFEHLSQLSTISTKIQNLFSSKKSLKDDYNRDIYDLTIKEIMSNGDYSELVLQVHDYISRIYANDEETMIEATNLVKGEYPIHISKRFIYDLLISNMKTYTKEEQKKLKLI